MNENELDIKLSQVIQEKEDIRKQLNLINCCRRLYNNKDFQTVILDYLLRESIDKYAKDWVLNNNDKVEDKVKSLFLLKTLLSSLADESKESNLKVTLANLNDYEVSLNNSN